MPKSTTANKIISRFVSEYEDKNGTNYSVNFPMIKSVEKIANFYSLGEIGEAMNYYFTVKPSGHSIWEFIDHIDQWLKGSRVDQESATRIGDLMRNTQRRIKDIESGT